MGYLVLNLTDFICSSQGEFSLCKVNTSTLLLREVLLCPSGHRNRNVGRRQYIYLGSSFIPKAIRSRVKIVRIMQVDVCSMSVATLEDSSDRTWRSLGVDVITMSVFRACKAAGLFWG